MASINQFKRYLWLVDVIYSAGEIAREEIDCRWVGSPYDDERDTLQSARVAPMGL